MVDLLYIDTIDMCASFTASYNALILPSVQTFASTSSLDNNIHRNCAQIHSIYELVENFCSDKEVNSFSDMLTGYRPKDYNNPIYHLHNIQNW